MFQLQHSPGRTAFVDGKQFLFFSGYSYLGMSFIPSFVELIKEGIDRLGILHPSARISNTQLHIYTEFEQLLSTITNTEDTVSFSSGYLAGRAVVDAFINEGTTCYILPNTHPTLDVKTKAFDGTIDELVTAINSNLSSEIVLLADAVNPLQASITDFSFLRSIDTTKNITCIIDDSHSIGLLSKNGSGIHNYLPKTPNINYILSYSLSKAFHINGGAISCNKATAEKLRQSTYYTSSTAIAPSLCFAFINSQDVYSEQHKKLTDNIRFFRDLIKDIPSIISHPELPILILPQDWDCSLFEQHQIIISSFSYPDPTGHKINRIVLNALHTKDDLQRLAHVLHSFK